MRTSDWTVVRVLSGPAHAATFSPDGAWLATGGWDGVLRVWDTYDWDVRLQTPTGHFGWIIAIAAFPDGRSLVTAGDTTVRIWNIIGTEGRTSIAGRLDDRDMHDEAGTKRRPRLWAIRRKTGRDAAPGAHANSPGRQSDRPLTAARDRGLLIAGEQAQSPPSFDQAGIDRHIHVNTVAADPNGSLLATAGLAGIQIVRSSDGAVMTSIASESLPNALAFGHDDRLLAVAKRNATIEVWSLPGGGPVALLNKHREWVWERDAIRGEPIKSYNLGALAAVFTPDGTRLFTAGGDGAVYVWNTGTWTPERVPEDAEDPKDIEGALGAMCMAPDGSWIAIGRGKIIQIRDPVDGSLRMTIRLESWSPSLAATSDSRRLIACDKHVCIWNVGDGTREATLEIPRDRVHLFALSPDDKLLASVADNVLSVWNVATAACTTAVRIDNMTQSCAWISATRLCVGSNDGLHVFDYSEPRI